MSFGLLIFVESCFIGIHTTSSFLYLNSFHLSFHQTSNCSYKCHIFFLLLYSHNLELRFEKRIFHLAFWQSHHIFVYIFTSKLHSQIRKDIQTWQKHNKKTNKKQISLSFDKAKNNMFYLYHSCVVSVWTLILNLDFTFPKNCGRNRRHPFIFYTCQDKGWKQTRKIFFFLIQINVRVLNYV